MHSLDKKMSFVLSKKAIPKSKDIEVLPKCNFFNLTKPKGQKDINVLDEADRGNPTIDNSGLTLDEIDLPSDYPRMVPPSLVFLVITFLI